MSQEINRRPNRRLALRNRPKSWTKASCRKGTLDLGPDLIAGILDVSEMGARLLIRVQLNKEQEVAVTLDTPGQLRPVRVVGLVVWSLATADGKFCIGVRFNKRLQYHELTKLT